MILSAHLCSAYTQVGSCLLLVPLPHSPSAIRYSDNLWAHPMLLSSSLRHLSHLNPLLSNILECTPPTVFMYPLSFRQRHMSLEFTRFSTRIQAFW